MIWNTDSSAIAAPNIHWHLPCLLSGAAVLPGLLWDCAIEFQRQCNNLLAVWVGDYVEQVIVALVSNGLYHICEIDIGIPFGHSTFQPPINRRDQYNCFEHLIEFRYDALCTLYVHPMHDQFWQYPVCHFAWHWQPYELHQLQREIVMDLLNCLLQYLKARNDKDECVN